MNTRADQSSVATAVAEAAKADPKRVAIVTGTIEHVDGENLYVMIEGGDVAVFPAPNAQARDLLRAYEGNSIVIYQRDGKIRRVDATDKRGTLELYNW